MYLWGDQRRFNSYNRFLKERFGGRMQKLALNAGFTCPNRDGRCGTGGCTYCLNDAFNPAYCVPSKNITQQLDEGIPFHQRPNNKPVGYLAYFQSFSNTYAPLSKLRALYEEALRHPAISGLIIATRPDCIENEVLDYLQELQLRTYIKMEIGLESCSDQTLQRINRGHDVDCAIQAIKRVAQHDIPVGTHLIFGLPGETPEQWISDLSIINQLPIHSIKFHQLQIIKGTAMAREYQACPEVFYPLPFQRYVEFMADYVEQLNPNIIIERFAGEVPTQYLAAPGWGGLRYDAVVKAIELELERRHSHQGSRIHPTT